MKERAVEKAYDKAFHQAAALNPVFPASAKEQMAQMVEAIAVKTGNIDAILSTDQGAAIKGGFIAEEFHSETFNLDAVLRGDKTRTYTDRDVQWSGLEWNGRLLKKNDIPDIALAQDGKVIGTAQAKYYAGPEDTARQMSQTKNNAPKYEEVDQLLGPQDQIDASTRYDAVADEHVDITTVREHAQAKAEALEAQGGDQAQIEAYRQTSAKSTSTLKSGKSSSSPLTKGEADRMGRGDTSKLKNLEDSYQTRSTLKQMGQAAVGAAALSAVVSGSINTVRYVRLAQEGRLSREEATLKIVGETVAAAADSALKASANAGVQSLLVRYGSEKAAMEVLARQGLKSMLKSNAVTVGVVCAVDAVKDLVRLGMGDISGDEFFERQGKGVLTTSAGAAGGALGAAGAGAAVSLFGAAAGGTAMTVAGIVGGLSGGLIAGLAMTLAVENGIEQPYRDLMTNTRTLHTAAAELERISGNLFKGQVLFTKFLEADAHGEKTLHRQFKGIDTAGQRALGIINQI